MRSSTARIKMFKAALRSLHMFRPHFGARGFGRPERPQEIKMCSINNTAGEDKNPSVFGTGRSGVFSAPVPHSYRRTHTRQLFIPRKTHRSARTVNYGGTRSMGFSRGTLVQHVKFGLTYIGGTLKGRVSLHSLRSGKRVTQGAKISDCRILTRLSWRNWSGRWRI